jgi:hypothetical protein
MFVCCECCVLSDTDPCWADTSSREVPPSAVRRCVWARNLMNERTMAPVGPQRHRRKK